MKSILFFITTAGILGTATFSNAQTLPSYLPTDGLVGYWPFNGNANDESGNNLNGNVVGPLLTTDRNGTAASAYSFDGQNDYIFIGNVSALATSSNNGFSISLWFYSNTFSTINTDLYDIRSTNSSSNQIYINDGSCGNGCIRSQNFDFPIWQSTGGTLSGFALNSSSNFQISNWVQIVYTQNYSTNENKIYVNGILSNDTIQQHVSLLSPAFNIGSRYSPYVSNPTRCCYFNGKLDDIGIWNRALTQQEITALYTSTPINGGGGNNNTASTNVPQGISYQAVARNAQGQPLSNTALQVKFTLLADSLTGTAEYSELHSLTTNDLGLFTTAFGTGTTLSGTFANINWAGGNKYLKVEMDAGNGFVALGTQQMLSVPYALQAKKSTLIENNALPVYTNNAAALAGGLVAGQMYRTATGDLKIVY